MEANTLGNEHASKISLFNRFHRGRLNHLEEKKTLQRFFFSTIVDTVTAKIIELSIDDALLWYRSPWRWNYNISATRHSTDHSFRSLKFIACRSEPRAAFPHRKQFRSTWCPHVYSSYALREQTAHLRQVPLIQVRECHLPEVFLFWDFTKPSRWITESCALVSAAWWSASSRLRFYYFFLFQFYFFW